MNPWAVITGHREDGRDASLRRVVARLRERGLRVGGFVQESVRAGDRVIGWDAVDLTTGERCALARESSEPDLCNWAFSQDALACCRRWACEVDAHVVVVELGRLEAGERGHWATLLQLLKGPRRLALLSVRPHPLAAIALRLPDPVAGLELPSAAGETDAFCVRVAEVAGD